MPPYAYASLSVPDPEFAALATQLPPPAIGDIAVTREIYNTSGIPMIMDTHRPNLPAESEYRIEDHSVLVEGGEIKVRSLTPTPVGEEGRTFPLLLWFHGGGWTFGNIDVDDFYLRSICVLLQISIVNVDYRLAPEHKFPVGLNDCYAALKWAAARPSLFSASLSQGFIVGGQSAGANLATTIMHRACADPFFDDKKLTGHILQIPCLLHPDAYPDEYKSELLSMEEMKDVPLLNRDSIHELYASVQAPPSDPDFSPLLFSHEGIPPLYIQVCGLDPLRDEGLLYEKLVRQAGVATRLDVYPGVPHAFYVVFPDIKAAVRFDKEFKEGIKWLLTRGS